MKINNKLDIPLLFFFFAFLIILFGLFSKFAFQKGDSPLNKSQSTATSKPRQMDPIKLNTLNYTLPILCDYQIKNSSISAAIDSSNSISATVMSNQNTQKYIVQSDCLYSWNIHEMRGTKKCGVGNYITLGKRLLSSGIGSTESLTSMLQKSGGVSPIDFQALFQTCKNVGEIKKEMFVIPKNVRFE